MKKKKSDKKTAILRATLELVAERGFHGAPAAEIAGRAGVGIGTIYRYFESKDELIVAVMRELEDKVAGMLLNRDFPVGGPVRDRFTHIVRGILAYNIANLQEFRFIEQFMNSPYGAAYRNDCITGEPGAGGISVAFRRVFTDGIAQGQIKDLPLPILHALTFGPVTLALRDHILGLVHLDDELIDATVEACWDAVSIRRA